MESVSFDLSCNCRTSWTMTDQDTLQKELQTLLEKRVREIDIVNARAILEPVEITEGTE